jgi:hypothetical protein
MVVVFVRMSPCGSVVPGDSCVGLRERDGGSRVTVVH